MRPAGTERALRPLLVGQAPASPAHEGQAALLGTSSGARLARLAGLPDERALLAVVDAVNLSPVFIPHGRLTLARLMPGVEHVAGLATGRPLVVCLGMVTARALGIDTTGANWFRPLAGAPGYRVAPHPSGRNRYWNDPGNVFAAEKFWQRVIRQAQDAQGYPREASRPL